MKQSAGGRRSNCSSIIRTMTMLLVCFCVSSSKSCLRSRGAFVGAFAPSSAANRFHQRQKNGLHSSSTDSSSSSNNNDQLLSELANPNNLRDQVVSAISKNGEIKVTVATVRNLLNDVMMRHTLTTTPADALGRTMISALLMSNGMQQDQTVQITLNSNGPLRGVVALCTAHDTHPKLKGYVGSPQVGNMHLSEAIGKGAVQVVKTHPEWNNPYNGITAIRHGDVDRDIGLYLAESEQTACALAAATTYSGILCTSAGGYLVEQLPGVSDETIAAVETNLGALVSKNNSSNNNNLPTNLLLQGMSPLDICAEILKDLDMQPLQQLEPTFSCGCSDDRLMRALRLLPPGEVEELLNETNASAQPLEARCEFCGTVYRMGPDEVRRRLQESRGDPAKDDEYLAK